MHTTCLQLHVSWPLPTPLVFWELLTSKVEAGPSQGVLSASGEWRGLAWWQWSCAQSGTCPVRPPSGNESHLMNGDAPGMQGREAAQASQAARGMPGFTRRLSPFGYWSCALIKKKWNGTVNRGSWHLLWLEETSEPALSISALQTQPWQLDKKLVRL